MANAQFYQQTVQEDYPGIFNTEEILTLQFLDFEGDTDLQITSNIINQYYGFELGRFQKKVAMEHKVADVRQLTDQQKTNALQRTLKNIRQFRWKKYIRYYAKVMQEFGGDKEDIVSQVKSKVISSIPWLLDKHCKETKLKYNFKNERFNSSITKGTKQYTNYCKKYKKNQKELLLKKRQNSGKQYVKLCGKFKNPRPCKKWKQGVCIHHPKDCPNLHMSWQEISVYMESRYVPENKQKYANFWDQQNMKLDQENEINQNELKQQEFRYDKEQKYLKNYQKEYKQSGTRQFKVMPNDICSQSDYRTISESSDEESPEQLQKQQQELNIEQQESKRKNSISMEDEPYGKKMKSNDQMSTGMKVACELEQLNIKDSSIKEMETEENEKTAEEQQKNDDDDKNENQ